MLQQLYDMARGVPGGIIGLGEVSHRNEFKQLGVVVESEDCPTMTSFCPIIFSFSYIFTN